MAVNSDTLRKSVNTVIKTLLTDATYGLTKTSNVYLAFHEKDAPSLQVVIKSEGGSEPMNIGTERHYQHDVDVFFTVWTKNTKDKDETVDEIRKVLTNNVKTATVGTEPNGLFNFRWIPMSDFDESGRDGWHMARGRASYIAFKSS